MELQTIIYHDCESREKSMFELFKDTYEEVEIDEQIMAIAKVLRLNPIPALRYSQNLPELPAGAERWLAVPAFTNAENYCRLYWRLQEVLTFYSKRFWNPCPGWIDPRILRIHANTTKAFNLLSQQQPGDILIVAAQLGLQYRGLSSRGVREARFNQNEAEVGLPSLAGVSILTHSKRLCPDELHPFFTGDEFGLISGEGGNRVPCLRYVNGGVEMRSLFPEETNEAYGAASLFLP